MCFSFLEDVSSMHLHTVQIHATAVALFTKRVGPFLKFISWKKNVSTTWKSILKNGNLTNYEAVQLNSSSIKGLWRNVKIGDYVWNGGTYVLFEIETFVRDILDFLIHFIWRLFIQTCSNLPLDALSCEKPFCPSWLIWIRSQALTCSSVGQFQSRLLNSVLCAFLPFLLSLSLSFLIAVKKRKRKEKKRKQ